MPINIYNRTKPSVVSISAIEYHRDPFSPRNLIETHKQRGSGFYYKDYIITNAHVVKGAMEIKINEADIETHIVDIDPMHDIAILSTSADKKEESLKACGDPVITIGNPYGFINTMTTGIVSGMNRPFDIDEMMFSDMIQTDAPINPGNSGGPLLSVNTATIQGSNNMAFVIPIEYVDRAIRGGADHKIVQLGISLLPEEYEEMLGLEGAIIADVFPGGIASILGIEGTRRDDSGKPLIGDIIIEINQSEIKTRKDLIKALSELNIDQPLKIKLSSGKLLYYNK